MIDKLIKSLIPGVAGAGVMSLVEMATPYAGLYNLHSAEHLAQMFHFPAAMGWAIHFGVGAFWGIVYAFVISPLIKTSNLWLKGAIFGVLVFAGMEALFFALKTLGIAQGVSETGDFSSKIMTLGATYIAYGVAVAQLAGNGLSKVAKK